MGSGLAICDLTIRFRGSEFAMGQLAEEIRQEQLAWAHRRLAALGPKWGQALRFAIWHRLAVIVILIN